MRHASCMRHVAMSSMAFVLLAASSTTQPFCISEIAEIMMQQVMDAAANFRQLDAAAWNRISYSPHY